MKRYYFADFITGPKPRVTLARRRFGVREYCYRCAGRGCEGWGTTPADSYVAWLRNWRRRAAFYGNREGRYTAVDRLLKEGARTWRPMQT